MSLVENAKPWGGLKRVIIAPDHNKVGYLHPENSNKWEDGSDVDWVEVESSGQNVMVEIPKFYYTKKTDGDRVYFGAAERIPGATDVEPHEWEAQPAFYRDRTKHLDDSTAEPIEVNYRYVGAFHGWVDGQGRLRSLPNKMPTANKTISEFRNHAKNNGVGWSQFDYYLLYAIQTLYITEYAHPDSQTVIGRGYVDDNDDYIETGNTLQYGNNTFGEATGKYQMSYRGIEDFYGNFYNWIDGIVTDSSYNILIGSKNFNDNGNGYDLYSTGISSNTHGNISDIHNDKNMGFVIKSTNSNSNYDDKFYDYGYLNASRVARFGGGRSSGSGAGAFLWQLNYSASGSSANDAARLAL